MKSITTERARRDDFAKSDGFSVFGDLEIAVLVDAEGEPDLDRDRNLALARHFYSLHGRNSYIQ